MNTDKPMHLTRPWDAEEKRNKSQIALICYPKVKMFSSEEGQISKSRDRCRNTICGGKTHLTMSQGKGRIMWPRAMSAQHSLMTYKTLEHYWKAIQPHPLYQEYTEEETEPMFLLFTIVINKCKSVIENIF